MSTTRWEQFLNSINKEDNPEVYSSLLMKTQDLAEDEITDLHDELYQEFFSHGLPNKRPAEASHEYLYALLLMLHLEENMTEWTHEHSTSDSMNEIYAYTYNNSDLLTELATCYATEQKLKPVLQREFIQDSRDFLFNTQYAKYKNHLNATTEKAKKLFESLLKHYEMELQKLKQQAAKEKQIIDYTTKQEIIAQALLLLSPDEGIQPINDGHSKNRLESLQNILLKRDALVACGNYLNDNKKPLTRNINGQELKIIAAIVSVFAGVGLIVLPILALHSWLAKGTPNFFKPGSQATRKIAKEIEKIVAPAVPGR